MGKPMQWVTLVFLGLLLAAALVVTQPLLLPGKRATDGGGDPADPARLEAHVRRLAALSPRDAYHPENLGRVADYVRGAFVQAATEAATGVTAEVSEQPFTADGGRYRNVIARFGPRTGERIVVGAHYDAAGPYPGADDNASGVAGLLELARLLGRVGSLPVRVELVAYPLEEPPYFATDRMGSAVHAAALRKEGVPVRAMLSLEMIGFFRDAPGSQRFPTPALRPFYPSRGNFITVVGRPGDAALVRHIKRAMRGATELPVYSICAPPALPGIDFSDHRNYWHHGYPAVMITDTAFYRNPHYHTEHDTPDTLDYRRMAWVVDGVLAALVAGAR
jgi:hypothetical protein